MKKSLFFIMIMVFILGISCSAFAAPAVYSDVPTGHWAYESLMKLSKAGIISGYSDGKYNGNQPMTRYEIATVVSNALTKVDKADDAAKAEIDKLQVEFRTELAVINDRVAAVEKKVNSFGNTQFGLFSRITFQSVKDSVTNPDTTFYRYRLWMRTPLDKNITWVARYGNEENVDNTYTAANATVYLQQSYLKIDAGNGWGINVGRQTDNTSTGGYIGRALIFWSTAGWDGFSVQYVKDQANFSVGHYQKNTLGGERTFNIGNMVYDFTPSFSLSGSYVKDDGIKGQTNLNPLDNTVRFNYTSVGTVLKFGDKNNWSIISEYGRNKNAFVATNSGYAVADGKNNHDAKGWFVDLKYGQTDTKKPGSWDVFAEYRKTDPGFDPWNGANSGLGGINNTGNNNYGGLGNITDNAKGIALYYELVPWKNVCTQFSWYSLTRTDGTGPYRQGVRLLTDFII